ncbi:MAG TPA: FUSC family protein [Acetobacteraceae bacterium]|jgi:uncharacterized membrane protein YccC|nr:FUSC family protein [Acetobacteraceae bacterium]
MDKRFGQSQGAAVVLLWPGRDQVAAWLTEARPLLLYGLRLWASVCLALFIAFELELQNPYWAATSAAIVCQPVLGASLRKGWFRMVGTVIGGVAAVVITAGFPQSRVGFLLALAAWGAVCGFVASLLRNFASYAAALAGYTAAIICADALGAVGGPAGANVFILAVTRASEICLGIVCSGIVVGATDFGDARRRMGAALAAIATEIAAGVATALSLPPSRQAESRVPRRVLVGRVGGLDTLMDQVLGETPALRFRPHALQAAIDGLFLAVSSWRAVANHLERLPSAEQGDPAAILSCLPEQLRTASGQDAGDWAANPTGIRESAMRAIRDLLRIPASTPSMRLLADETAGALLGLCRALMGLRVLAEPRHADASPRVARLRVPDLLPPLLNALRVFLTIIVAELIWIVTAWPGGAVAVMFAAITVILFSPREDAAFATAQGFMIGTAITAVLAAIVDFAILPQQPTFAGFCLTCGVVLVPAGALSAQPWHGPLFVALTANFIPLLGPSNPMTFDPAAFYNSALGILVGVGLAILALRLMPPLPPAMRARRLVALTLRDFRRLTIGTLPESTLAWSNRVYGRLTALPEHADLLQSARLIAALALGTQLIRLSRLRIRLPALDLLSAVLTTIAAGDSGRAIEQLRQVDGALTSAPAGNAALAALQLRARGMIAEARETLHQHADYFSGEVDA